METYADLPLAERHSPQPGLIVARRCFLASVAAALAAARLPGTSPRWQWRQDPAERFPWKQFVAEVTPVCRELLADHSPAGQDRYLLALASHAVRLTEVPIPDLQEVGPGHRIGSNHGPDPFTALHWELEPNAAIAPHAHTYGNVVTLGLAGWARVCNYEVTGARDFDSTDPFTVQRTNDQILRPGDVNLVSLERHYVHGFTAGSHGARGLDITTRILQKRRAPTLQLGREVDAAMRTFAATWK